MQTQRDAARAVGPQLRVRGESTHEPFPSYLPSEVVTALKRGSVSCAENNAMVPTYKHEINRIDPSIMTTFDILYFSPGRV